MTVYDTFLFFWIPCRPIKMRQKNQHLDGWGLMGNLIMMQQFPPSLLILSSPRKGSLDQI